MSLTPSSAPSRAREPRPVLWASLAISLGVVVATFIAARSWTDVKTRPAVRTIEVTGSAKKRIVSDLIEWSAAVQARGTDRTAAFRALRADVDKTLAYLTAQGVPDAEIEVSAAQTSEIIDTEYVGTGESRVERQVSRGWTATESVTVRSSDVGKVEKVSREVTALLEQGVTIQSAPPAYFYTKLGDLKIEMLSEASRDARNRAENMVKAAGGGALGNLRNADMGVININPPNSSATSWEGNNDTSSLEKDILTIVHATFELR
jgi:hypothetical protein